MCFSISSRFPLVIIFLALKTHECAALQKSITFSNLSDKSLCYLPVFYRRASPGVCEIFVLFFKHFIYDSNVFAAQAALFADLKVLLEFSHLAQNLVLIFIMPILL